MTKATLSADQAHKILVDPVGKDPQAVREALLLISRDADYKLIGICAESLAESVNALKGYLAAFGYQEPLINVEAVEPIEPSGVFLKFNPKNSTCFVSPYLGTERGVIVSCFSPDSGINNETYGNLPLDLFDHH